MNLQAAANRSAGRASQGREAGAKRGPGTGARKREGDWCVANGRNGEDLRKGAMHRAGALMMQARRERRLPPLLLSGASRVENLIQMIARPLSGF